MIQLQFLNKILSTKDITLITKNNLNIDYFSDYKEEFKFIDSYISKYGNTPDLETFVAKFPSFDVINVNDDTAFLTTELYKDRNARYIVSTYTKMGELLKRGDIDDAINLFTKAGDGISKGNAIKCTNIFEDTERYKNFVAKMSDYGKFFVKTGFQELDRIIGGWDRQEELATIVARPGVGKSWVLLKCALAAAMQGLKVGIYSGEMSKDLVGYRLDTLLSHISNGALIHGSTSVELEYKNYIDNMKNLVKGSIVVLTPYDIDGTAGVRALRTFVEQEGIDILFVDQHSLLEDDNKAKTSFERAANISKDLKKLQVLKKVPIIAVSQQNREKTDNDDYSTTQVAGSDRIPQDSTLMIFLDKKDGVLKLQIVKSRNSEMGRTLSYKVDLNKGEFIYIPEDGEDVEINSNELENRYSISSTKGDDVF